eukprot:GHVS01027114.1.p1 GENE.GHVS01027114.1~~GHVS01027114.1.p1  ORF type:complete len:440 (-),score=57.83 GHVS01027114.1:56-1333(-)
MVCSPNQQQQQHQHKEQEQQQQQQQHDEQEKNKDHRRLPNICMVCDFFYPKMGGVEMHIYQLSQCLLLRGFKVIVLTHYSGNRHGVRYMANGLKVYYLPFASFHDDCTLITIYSLFPLIRNVLIREQIDIVHGHQAVSNLAHECLFHARTMGYRVVYTDHSLFGFADSACIHVNKVIKCLLSDLDHAICVSHTNKENLVLRAVLNPRIVSVINNAVDSSCFVPKPKQRPAPPTINIVVLSRLAYRKGIDLLVDVIPHVCEKMPHINFIVGGDGPKRIILEEMRERHRLHDRVELLGAVPHAEVAGVLQRGHIFLNSSLTEAFCIAIIEAASCGLLVVSTRVGGVPEVLPGHMMRLAEPEATDLCDTLIKSVQDIPAVDPFQFHREVSQMYSWHDVALRTVSPCLSPTHEKTTSFTDNNRRRYIEV